MTKLKRDIANAIANFEITISKPNNYAMSKKDFEIYKKKYNEALKVATQKVFVLMYNAFGKLF